MKQENYAVVYNDEVIFIGTHEQAKAFLSDAMTKFAFYSTQYDNQIDIFNTKFWNGFRIIELRQYHRELYDNWVTWGDRCDVAF